MDWGSNKKRQRHSIKAWRSVTITCPAKSRDEMADTITGIVFNWCLPLSWYQAYTFLPSWYPLQFSWSPLLIPPIPPIMVVPDVCRYYVDAVYRYPVFLRKRSIKTEADFHFDLTRNPNPSCSILFWIVCVILRLNGISICNYHFFVFHRVYLFG